MDPENKPNMQGTRIGGGYMVVVYGSGGGSGGSIWIWIGGGILTRIGGGICGLGLVVHMRMYMWTRIGGGQANVYGSGKEYVGGVGIW